MEAVANPSLADASPLNSSKLANFEKTNLNKHISVKQGRKLRKLSFFSFHIQAKTAKISIYEISVGDPT